MRHIIYRTENTVNGDFYYGKRSIKNNNTNDRYYIGSGVRLLRSVKKYGKENFTRRTIMEFNTAQEAFDFEALLVDDLMLSNPKCLNLTSGGFGGDRGPNSGQFKKGHTPWSKGLKTGSTYVRTDDHKKIQSEKNRNNPKHNPKAVIIDGIEYPSLSEVVRQGLSNSVPAVKARVNGPRFSTWQWKEVGEV